MRSSDTFKSIIIHLLLHIWQAENLFLLLLDVIVTIVQLHMKFKIVASQKRGTSVLQEDFKAQVHGIVKMETTSMFLFCQHFFFFLKPANDRDVAMMQFFFLLFI